MFYKKKKMSIFKGGIFFFWGPSTSFYFLISLLFTKKKKIFKKTVLLIYCISSWEFVIIPCIHTRKTFLGEMMLLVLHIGKNINGGLFLFRSSHEYALKYSKIGIKFQFLTFLFCIYSSLPILFLYLQKLKLKADKEHEKLKEIKSTSLKYFK